jgi:hypothetical protein
VKNIIKNIYKPKASTPYETNQGSIGVDNEILLLKHEHQQNDQVMDLFLNQVAEYNTQHTSFDQQQQASSSQQNDNNGNNNVDWILLFSLKAHFLFFSK